MKIRILTIAALVLLSTVASDLSAQDVKNLGDEQINVVKQYQPTLSDAYKISSRPSKDTSKYAFPVLNYDVEPIRFATEFNISPIKAVSIKDNTIVKLYHGFVKAGYGNYNTPSLDFLYNTARSGKNRGGVELHHLSSTPIRSAGKAIKDRGYPGFSDSKINLHGEKFFDETKLGAAVSYERNAVYFYGYDTDNALFTKKATRRTIQTPELSLTFGSNHYDKDRIIFETGLGFYNSFDRDKTSETGFLISSSAEKRFDVHNVEAAFDLSFNNLKQPERKDAGSAFSKANAYYKYEQGLLRAEAGLNFNYIDDTRSRLRIYPHVDINFEMIDDALLVYGILSGSSKQNIWKNLVNENPWIAADQKLLSSNHKFILEGGLRGKIEKNLSLHAGLAYERITDAYFFVNDSAGFNPVKFIVGYDDADLIRFNAEIAYKYKENIDFAVGMKLNKYELDYFDKPFNKPLMQFTLSGNYTIAEKIYIKPLLKYNAKTYGYDYLTDGSVEIDPWLDLNLGVDYRYSKILSIWLQMNNLGFAKYDRYFNYPTYRFNGMAGVSYSF